MLTKALIFQTLVVIFIFKTLVNRDGKPIQTQTHKPYIG